MSQKEDIFTLKGTVKEVFPSTLFNVLLENGLLVLCHLSGKMRKNQIKVILGDTVDVEMSVYDLTKGRLTFRYKK